MIRRAISILVLLVTVFVSGSCKKDKREKTGESLSFKVGDTLRQLPAPFNVIAQIYSFSNRNMLGISGTINDKEVIVLSVKDFKGVGDYPVNSENGITYTADVNNSETYIGVDGIITITSSSSDFVIKGTFQATTKNLAGTIKVITEGKFETKIDNI